MSIRRQIIADNWL